jgi:hypothetical protein
MDGLPSIRAADSLAFVCLGTVTLVVFVALVGLRLAMQWGWLKEIRSLTLGLGVTGIVILALTGYWGGELVYAYGIGVKVVMSPMTPELLWFPGFFHSCISPQFPDSIVARLPTLVGMTKRDRRFHRRTPC